jgi:hypothetical protein
MILADDVKAKIRAAACDILKYGQKTEEKVQNKDERTPRQK